MKTESVKAWIFISLAFVLLILLLITIHYDVKDKVNKTKEVRPYITYKINDEEIIIFIEEDE